MNKLRLKSFFVLLVALLCVCTVLAAISGIYHANQLAAIAGSQGKTAINALMLQLTILVVFSLVIAGIALGVFQTRLFTPLRQLRLHLEAIAGGDLIKRILPS